MRHWDYEVTIEYTWDHKQWDDDKCYVASVWAHLPAKDGAILPMFCSSEVSFWGEELRPRWGNAADDKAVRRWNLKIFAAPTLSELRQKIENYIQHEMEKLRKVVCSHIEHPRDFSIEEKIVRKLQILFINII